MLRTAYFATESLDPGIRYEAWRNLVSAVFEPRPALPAESGLSVRAMSVDLGGLLVVGVHAEAQDFIRTRRLIALESLDHYLIQVYSRGVCRGDYGDLRNTVRPGDIKIVDLSRPFVTSNTDFDNITMTIPRNALAPLLARPDALHGTVLPRENPRAAVLASHIRQVFEHARALMAEDAGAMGVATVRLVAACLGSNPRARDEARAGHAAVSLSLVRDFIEQNLTSANLNPSMVAERFRMSRAQLYRLFPMDGGVAAYIRARRLRACYLAITGRHTGKVPIGAIAFRYGFGSEAHFSRAFRGFFGISPTEARSTGQAASRPFGGGATSEPDFINDWMRKSCCASGMPQCE
jgi:AraC-like DNA-binding protein